MKEARVLYRQGDVLIRDVDEIPKDAKPIKGRVLASGEVTGHNHAIAERKAARLFLRPPQSPLGAAPEHRARLFLRVLAEQATLRHPEHAEVVLPRGCYVVWQQREFIDGVARTVAD